MSPPASISVFIPLTLRRRNGRPRIVPPADMMPSNDSGVDPHVLRAIARAWSWRRRLENGTASTIADIAQGEGVTERRRAPSRPDVDELRIGTDGPLTTELRLARTSALVRDREVPLVFTAPPASAKMAPYANVLLDILSGGHTLSVSAGEEEEAWRILDPLVQAWRADDTPPPSYTAGTVGPPRLEYWPAKLSSVGIRRDGES